MAALAPAVWAQTPAADYGLRFDSVSCAKSDNQLMVSMTVDPSQARMPSCDGLRLTPVVTAGDREVRLPEIYVAGRKRYIMLRRDDASRSIHRDNGGPFPYLVQVDYENWMRRSTLRVLVEESGCAGALKSEGAEDIAAIDFRPKEFAPKAVVLAKPVAVEKQRSIEKTAYIDFPVNRYAIEPNYRRNASELAGIRASIDEVKADADATIRSVAIKGFASPEGTYAGNERLARERSKALAEYVRSLYSFSGDIMKTSWVAENWEGLCSWLEANPTFADGKEILSIASGSLPDDEREALIRRRYPAAYSTLLRDVYPGLRRSDYRIDYTIRPFTDPKEIARVMKADPSKLSLYELYRLAETLEPGSEDYREVFEVAVRLYPDEQDANVNAASTALLYNNLDKAEGYLKKSGQSAEADYLRGVLAAKRNDFITARRYFESVKSRGLGAEADEALALIAEME